mgnify:CR=1 FL=1
MSTRVMERYALIRSGETLRGDRVIGLYANEETALGIRREKEKADHVSEYHVLPESQVPVNMLN